MQFQICAVRISAMKLTASEIKQMESDILHIDFRSFMQLMAIIYDKAHSFEWDNWPGLKSASLQLVISLFNHKCL